MALEEANAVLRSLVAEEHQPAKRARLVALQLALGFPHALEIEPEHLVELRKQQNETVVLRAQSALAAASSVALVWCGAMTLVLIAFLHRDARATLPLFGFAIGAVHGLVGLMNAWQRPSLAALSVLAWLWLCAPAFGIAMALRDGETAGIATLITTLPSMLVSLAATRVSRAAR